MKCRFLSLQELAIDRINTPAESPDMNPIELVWHSLKVFLQGRDTTTLAQVIAGIKEYWTTKLDVALCNRYIDHVESKVFHKVVERQGKSTGY